MKTSFGKASLAAALLGLAPLVSDAQNIVGQPRTVNRSIDRLTLLPGPYLLSPARTTPTMMPSPIKLDTPPEFRFVPATEHFTSGGGTLRLMDRSSVDPLSLSGRIGEMPQKAPRPPPETLRFESTLQSPYTPLKIELGPKPATPGR